ncbi:MAG TPA: arsenate reductase (glutaredoxin) [Methylomicrobium sp.]|nr:arsenate reductase (glutaredoxin) [Methylomicrobium sp.]
MSIKIYHNPRCSKSRETLQLLRDRGIEPEIVEYLKTPPSEQELDAILQKLGMEPRDLMRKKEAPYDENDLLAPSLDRQTLIQAMVRFPILIERPIVVNGDKAAIGRPPEKVLAIL